MAHSVRGFSLWLARLIALWPKINKKEHHGEEYVVEPSCSPAGDQEAESELFSTSM